MSFRNHSVINTPTLNKLSLKEVGPSYDHKVVSDKERASIFARWRLSMKRYRNNKKRPETVELPQQTQSIPTTMYSSRDHAEVVKLNNRFAVLADEVSDAKVAAEIADMVTKEEFPNMNMQRKTEACEKFLEQRHQYQIDKANANGNEVLFPYLGIDLPTVEALGGPTPMPEEHSTQTDSWEVGCGTDEMEYHIAREEAIQSDSSFVATVERNKRLALKQKVKIIRSYNKLYYYLKCKHLFAPRSTQLLITMRADARIWMLGNDFGLTTEYELQILGDAVLAAFKLHAIELKARYMMYREDIDNIAKHNKAMSGTYTPGIRGKPRVSSLLPWSTSVKLPPISEQI